MKLATLHDGSRDGRLAVVSRDLAWYTDATSIAPTLQAALDEWSAREPQLRRLAAQLEKSSVSRQPFDATRALAPLPRAYHWVDGSAYVNHVELVRRARGAPMPATFWTSPLVYQGGSDDFTAPCGDIVVPSEAYGIDFEAELAIITDDVPMQCSEQDAESHIKLIMLVNDVSLRNLIPGELEKGFGFYQSKPSTSFSPVAVTPDELGTAWTGARVHLPLAVDLNHAPFGRANAGRDMTFSFAQLIQHATKTRRLGTGTVIGSGTVSNRDEGGGPGKPIAEGGLGYSCIAEMRTVETIAHGSPVTPFMRQGDQVRIEMRAPDGSSVFGAIAQKVVCA